MTAKKKVDETKKKAPAPEGTEPITENTKNEQKTAPEKASVDPKLTELKDEVEALVTKYNNAMKLAHGQLAAKVKEQIDEKVAKYEEESRLDFGYQCREAANPMAKALQLMNYSIIKITVRKDEATKLDLMSWDTAERQIDLIWLHKYIDNGIGCDKTWLAKARKFNKGLSAMANGALGSPIKDFEASYKIDAEANSEEGFKTGEHTGLNAKDKAIRNDIEIIVRAMIGEEFVQKFDTVVTTAKKKSEVVTYGDAIASYLLMSHTSRRSNGLISTAREGSFVKALATVCGDLMYAEQPASTLLLKLGMANKK